MAYADDYTINELMVVSASRELRDEDLIFIGVGSAGRAFTMAVGIPIIPIVIRNAEIVAARNSTTINPGTVDVAVFPPIPVDDWTLDNLPERIAAVRQLYLDALADWPDEIPAAIPKAAAKKIAKKTAPKAAPKKAAKKIAKKEKDPDE